MQGRLIRMGLPLVLLAVMGVGVAMAATTSMRASGGTVKVVASSKYGKVLAAANGMTLYRYTPDKKGVSVCSGACAKYWPPLLLKGTAKETAGSGASAGLLGTIKRGNAKQVTYAGFPLYLYAGDSKPGDVKGEGFEKIWYAVSAKGALVKQAVAPTKTTSSRLVVAPRASALGVGESRARCPALSGGGRSSDADEPVVHGQGDDLPGRAGERLLDRRGRADEAGGAEADAAADRDWGRGCEHEGRSLVHRAGGRAPRFPLPREVDRTIR